MIFSNTRWLRTNWKNLTKNEWITKLSNISRDSKTTALGMRNAFRTTSCVLRDKLSCSTRSQMIATATILTRMKRKLLLIQALLLALSSSKDSSKSEISPWWLKLSNELKWPKRTSRACKHSIHWWQTWLSFNKTWTLSLMLMKRD
jgi:hypothetical protein